jgi:hypothetical protein
MKRFPGGVALLLLLLCGVGCGSKYDVVPVSGVITLDGQPLADATVSTQPAATPDNPNPGPGSYAHTDAEGRFALGLQTEKVQAGAIPGTHRVYISRKGEQRESSNDEVARSDLSDLPRQYWDGSLTFEIPPGGTDAMNFDLVGRKGRR